METIQETLPEACAALGLSLVTQFIPWSQSRDYEHGKPVGKRMAQWRVTLLRDGKPIITTDYGQGIGHLPAYKASIKELGNRDCSMRMEAIERELETGKVWDAFLAKPQTIPGPDMPDVVHSLCVDADVLQHRSFEDWAADFGYDADSRKAENIYRSCMQIALQLLNGLGAASLERLQLAAREY